MGPTHMYGDAFMEGRSSSMSIYKNSQEEALHGLCKQILKSKLFRGFYLERQRVNVINSYRDIVVLHRSEFELEKLLLDIQRRLSWHYRNIKNFWVGISSSGPYDVKIPPASLKTILWVELQNLAFGQYWFSIRTLKLRQNEIILKLKVVRAVELEKPEVPFRKSLDRKLPPQPLKTEEEHSQRPQLGQWKSVDEDENQKPSIQDFIDIFNQWGISFKQYAYDFMSKDVSKDNIVNGFRFLGLLIISCISFGLMGIKYIGIFVLRFMFEFTRLAHVLTPVVLKFIDLSSKVIGGFYLLLAMIWKDLFCNQRNKPPVSNLRAIECYPQQSRNVEYRLSSDSTLKDR